MSTGSSLLVGSTTFIKRTTDQFDNGQAGYGYFTKQRLGDAAAAVIGHDMTAKLIPGWTGAADSKINVWGIFNTDTFVGGLVLLGDRLVKKAHVPYYSKISPLIKGSGLGLLLGGAVGGFFDPAQVPRPNSYAGLPAPQGGAQGGVANPIQWGQS